MTPYERIDQLEAIMRDLTARLARIEQHPALSVPPIEADRTVPGSTLHLPAKAKH